MLWYTGIAPTVVYIVYMPFTISVIKERYDDFNFQKFVSLGVEANNFEKIYRHRGSQMCAEKYYSKSVRGTQYDIEFPMWKC
jgi:hypothetical protein